MPRSQYRASVDDRAYYVYIVASRRNGTLYIGITRQLAQRTWEHREGFVDGFAKTYGTHRLVWFETHATAEAAILREKQLKKWNRAWKLRLIEEANPYWSDLSGTLV